MKSYFFAGKYLAHSAAKPVIVLSISFLLFIATLAGCDRDVDCHCDGCEECSDYNSYETLFERQEEAQDNLLAIHTVQTAYFGEFDCYSMSFDDMFWGHDWGTRYAYFIDGDSIQPDLGGPYQLPSWIYPATGPTSFTVVAVGNIDCDATLDVWTINSQRLLVHHVNDITQ